MMKLIRPTAAYIPEIQTFREAFTSSPKGIEGSSLLQEADSIETWINQMEKNRYAETVQEGWVAADQYIAVDEETGDVVGVLNLRKELNDVLFNYYGHIGYAVSPNRRRQGVGTHMLQLALIEAKEIGLERVLITCDDNNVGSYGVIENNGGVLEDKRVNPSEGKLTRRYWIDL